MNIRTRWTICLRSFECMSVLAWGLAGTPLALCQDGERKHEVSQHRNFDKLASESRKGSQEQVEAATDQMFQLIGVPPIATETLSIKSRVTHSEMQHKSGRHANIGEERVVSAVNGIAERLNLPAYARTTPSEVRRIHVRMVGAFPRFVTSPQALARGNRKSLMINTQMSPLEAVTLTSMVIQQKVHNPDFQLTKEEAFQVRTGKTVDVRGRSTEMSLSFDRAPIRTLAALKAHCEKTLDDLGIAKEGSEK